MTLQSSPDSEQEEWTLVPAPPLYKKGQVRVQVFGFPVGEEDLHTWAEKQNIPEDDDDYKRHRAWKAIGARLPRNHRRFCIIHNPSAASRQSLCFMVGSNFNAEDMKLTQDIELVKSLYDAIDMGNRPGWFYISRG